MWRTRPLPASTVLPMSSPGTPTARRAVGPLTNVHQCATDAPYRSPASAAPPAPARLWVTMDAASPVVENSSTAPASTFAPTSSCGIPTTRRSPSPVARRSRTSPKRSPASAFLVPVEVLLHDREIGVGVHGGPVEPDHPAGVLALVHIATGDTDRDRAPGVRGDRAAEAVARLRATRAGHRLVIDGFEAAEAALRAAQPVDLPRAGLAQDVLPRRPHEKVGAVVRVVDVGDVVPGTDGRAEPGTRLRLQPIEVVRGQQRPRGRRPRIRGTPRGDVGEHHDRAGVRLAGQVVRRQAERDVRAAAIQVRGDVVPARGRGRHTGQPEHGDREHRGGQCGGLASSPRRSDHRASCYFQRSMNSAVAGLTSAGFEALRKCRPPSTTRSSAPGLVDEELHLILGVGDEWARSSVPCIRRTGQRAVVEPACRPSRSRRLWS